MSKRKKNQKRKTYFILQIAMLGVLTLSILIMPLADYFMKKMQSDIPIYINSILFWVGFVGLVVVSVLLSTLRKNSSFAKRDWKETKRLGLIHFFQNKEATIADCVMIVSLIGFVVVSIWCPTQQILGFFLLALFVFSFGMHWMLNGANYLFIKERKRGENNV